LNYRQKIEKLLKEQLALKNVPVLEPWELGAKSNSPLRSSNFVELYNLMLKSNNKSNSMPYMSLAHFNSDNSQIPSFFILRLSFRIPFQRYQSDRHEIPDLTIFDPKS